MNSRLVLAAASLLLASPGLAAPPIIPPSDTEQVAPAMPPILPMRERAEVIDRILAERLETIVPAIMREQGIDMWVLMARE